MAVTVATWIEMHRERLERQRAGIVAHRRASGDKVLDIDTRAIDRLIDFMQTLIIECDNTFSIHDWELAAAWIDDLLGGQSHDTGTTDPPSNAVGNR